MKGITRLTAEDALIPTPVAGDTWRGWTGLVRTMVVRDELPGLDILNCAEDGSVFVRLRIELPAEDRGTFLRILERHLKRKVDKGCRILVEPIADKNKARQWRGVVVKDETHGT